MNLSKSIKALLRKSPLKRSKVNPHKDVEAIKEALSRCYSDNGMDYETFYNDLDYVSPGIHLKNYYAMLAPSTNPDMTGYFHLTVENKDLWVSQCNEVGFTFVEFIGEDGIIFKK